MAKKAKKQKLAIVGEVLTCEYPSIGKKLVVDLAKYDDSIRFEAMLHGFKQKFGDAASGQSAAEKYAEVQAIHASLLEGEWERTATPDMTPLICEAIARIQKKPLAKVQEAAEKAGAEKVKEWGSNAKVKAAILEIRAEKAAKAAEDSDEEIDIEV
jgi:hypothetical protein